MAGPCGFIALAMMPGLTTPASAQTYTWQGATDDYNSFTNWSPPSGAPVNWPQAAIFDSTGSTTVNVTAGPINPVTWTFTANSQNYAIFGQFVQFVDQANLINNANAGQSISIANNMAGAGISQAGASTLTLSGFNDFTTTTITNGTLVNTGSLTSTVSNSATFTNTNNLFGDVTNSGTFGNSGAVTGSLSQSAGTTTNSGTITSTVDLTGGTFNNNAWGQVQGTTTITAGTVTNNGGTFAAVSNGAAGTFNNTTGSAGAVTNAGTATNGDTIASLDNTGGTFSNTGTVTGASTVSGGAVTNAGSFSSTLGVSGGTFQNNFSGIVLGTTTITGGTVSNNGGTFAAVSNGTAGTFNNTTGNAGAVTNAGTATNGGTIASLNNTGGTFSNTGTVTGASTVSGGAVTNAGTFSDTLGVSGGTFQNNAGGKVWGTTTITGGTVTNNGGTLGVVSNGAGGTFNNTTGNAGTVINAGTATNGGTILVLDNTGGTFSNTGTVTGVSIVSGGAVTNAGTFASAVDVSGGTFQNNVSGIVSDTTTIIAGTVTNNGGTFAAVSNAAAGTFNNTTGNAGAVTNAGTATNGGAIASLANTGGTFQNNVGGAVSGTTTITGGTVTNNGGTFAAVTNTTGTFTNTAGSVSGPVTNTATFNANGGGINGAIANNAGGTFNVGGTVTSSSAFDNSTATSRLLVNSGTYTLSGLLTNSGTNAGGGVFVNAGSTLNANGGFTNNAGATFVNQGTFSSTGTGTNDGTITGSLNILGGSLSGIGTISGTATIAGGATLASGNGTAGSSMTVGSLAFQSGAIYLVQIDPSTASFTNVTGTATLGGATISANFANGSYVAKQYTILTAGSINGNFDPTVANTNLPSGFKTTLSYDGTHAYLDLALGFTPPSGQLNVDQQNVGNAIVNFFNTTGSIPLVFGGLTPAGLTQLSGEGATATQQTTFNAMNQFMGVMTDPFIAGRGDPVSAGGGAAGYADEALAYAGKRKPNDALAAIYTKAPPVLPFEQRWSVWAAGFGGSQRTDGNTVLGSNDTRSSIYGTAVGADYRLAPNTLAGFALAGGGTNFSVNGLGSGRSDLFQAGVFLRHNAGPAYLAAALAYGWQDVTTDRTVTIAGVDQLRAKFNANAWSGRLEGGYRFVAQGLGLTPYAAGQFTTFDLPTYAEQVVSGANTFALAYGAKTATATRSELGLRADKSVAMQDGLLTLRGRLAWAHDYNTDRNVGATFQTLPGASFVVNGARMAPDSALTTASAEWKWLSGWSAAATFEGEFSNVTRSYAGKGVVRYAW